MQERLAWGGLRTCESDWHGEDPNMLTEQMVQHGTVHLQEQFHQFWFEKRSKQPSVSLHRMNPSQCSESVRLQLLCRITFPVCR
jgi:hypothetical protein